MEKLILKTLMDNVSKFSKMTDTEIYDWICNNFYCNDYEMMRKCSFIIFKESRDIG